MYKSVWYIIKKECSRFLKDRQMILVVLLLPAVLMYGMYTLMGISFKDTYTIEEGYRFKCYVQNAPASYAAIFETMNFELTDTEDADAAKDLVADKEADLVVIFPADFDDKLLNPSEDGSVPNIQVYYNQDNTKSQVAYGAFLDATEELETSIVNVLDVNRDVEDPDISKKSSVLLSFIPTMVLMTLFASCAGMAPESIAGEKERGTFATLLVTPISRTAIAIGKIISLSFFALLGGLSNFVGMILGMRNMLPEAADGMIPKYGVAEYAWLLLLIMTAVLMAVSIVSVISAFAKSVKSASATATAVSLVGSLGGMVTMFSFATGLGWRFVPILGTAISLNDIFSMEYASSDIIVTCVSNLIVMLAMVFILSKMFNSEKIMFNKA